MEFNDVIAASIESAREDEIYRLTLELSKLDVKPKMKLCFPQAGNSLLTPTYVPVSSSEEDLEIAMCQSLGPPKLRRQVLVDTSEIEEYNDYIDNTVRQAESVRQIIDHTPRSYTLRPGMCLVQLGLRPMDHDLGGFGDCLYRSLGYTSGDTRNTVAVVNKATDMRRRVIRSDMHRVAFETVRLMHDNDYTGTDLGLSYEEYQDRHLGIHTWGTEVEIMAYAGSEPVVVVDATFRVIFVYGVDGFSLTFDVNRPPRMIMQKQVGGRNIHYTAVVCV